MRVCEKEEDEDQDDDYNGVDDDLVDDDLVDDFAWTIYWSISRIEERLYLTKMMNNDAK